MYYIMYYMVHKQNIVHNSINNNLYLTLVSSYNKFMANEYIIKKKLWGLINIL